MQLKLKTSKLKKTAQVVAWNSLDKRTTISPVLCCFLEECAQDKPYTLDNFLSLVIRCKSYLVQALPLRQELLDNGRLFRNQTQPSHVHWANTGILA